MSEHTTILGVMPHTEELKKHAYHRLAMVLWVITFLPTLGYLFVLLPEESFHLKVIDLVGLVLFGLLTVPIIYRVLLYIFVGNTEGRK